MNTITQFKNAIALIVIAGAIIFIGDIVTAASPEVVTPDVSSAEVVTTPEGQRHVSSPEVDTPDVVITPGRAILADFNGDLRPDFVLYNHSTRQTAIWYMNNNVHIGSHLGPTIPTGWVLECAEDFNDDNHTDYALFNPAPTSRRTLFDFMSGPTLIGTASGPTLPSGWELVATDDFNLDGFADYVLYNPSSHQTAIWYLHNNIRIGTASGPTLLTGWKLVGVEDFNDDNHPDYALFNPVTHHTQIWYMSGPTRIGTASGPTLPIAWDLVAAADFNNSGHPDYLLYNPVTRHTAIWYLHNNVFIGSAAGPTLPVNWSLIAQ